MKIGLLSTLLFAIIAASPLLQAENQKLKKFDVFVEPGVSVGFGSYKFENDFDTGSLTIADLGGRAGLKLGYIYLGFEYRNGSASATSDRRLQPSDRITYPLIEDGELVSVGFTLGYQWGRVHFWGTIYNESIEQHLEIGDERFIHDYDGQGYRAAISINVYKNIHAGIYAHSRTFDKYSSTHSTDDVIDQDLANKFNGLTYGMTLTYFIPFIEFVETKSWD